MGCLEKKNVGPSVLGFTAERGENFCLQFQKRVKAETDIERFVDCIVPSEVLFDPDILLPSITTPNGPIEIKRLGNAKALARYEPNNKRICISPKLDRFSTVVAVAKGNFQNVVGIELAREALRAYQAVDQKAIDSAEETKSTYSAIPFQRTDAGTLLIEAVQSRKKSEDLTIITETQAYVLQFTLTGGTSVVDFVADKMRDYLPKKAQNNHDYSDRIKSATLQIIRLLDKGVSHCKIADLIRNNYQAIDAGSEWDEAKRTYKFLHHSAAQLGGKGKIDDKELLERFNQQTENRVMKIRSIAMEELARK